MKFDYRAKDRTGKLCEGHLDADSSADARRRLRDQGLFVLALDSAKRSGARSKSRSAGRARGRRVKPADIVMFMSQLTIMCQSGVDLAEAIRNVAQQCPRPALRAVLEVVYQDVSNGASFSAALARHPLAFDETFVAGIAAGEHSGAIIDVLQRLTHLMRSEMRLRSGVWSMLMYPIVLCGVTGLVLTVMVFFVLPQFAKVFEDLDRTPPAMTQLLLGAAQFAREHVVALAVVAAGLAAVAYRLRSAAAVRRYLDHASLNLALLRNATRALATGRAFRLLGTMLQAGVPLLEGLQLSGAAARNQLFRALFAKLEHEVLQGQGVGEVLLASPFLPEGAAHMVATAERTGNLGTVLQSVGEYFEDEGERHVRDLVKVLEPAVIIFLGVIVAVVVLSVVLPLLDVSTMSQ